MNPPTFAWLPGHPADLTGAAGALMKQSETIKGQLKTVDQVRRILSDHWNDSPGADEAARLLDAHATNFGADADRLYWISLQLTRWGNRLEVIQKGIRDLRTRADQIHREAIAAVNRRRPDDPDSPEEIYRSLTSAPYADLQQRYTILKTDWDVGSKSAASTIEGQV